MVKKSVVAQLPKLNYGPPICSIIRYC